MPDVQFRTLQNQSFMEFTYYGHACFAVKVNNSRLLFDPFITPNPLAVAKNIDVAAIEADYILLSHGHADHTADCITIAQRTGAAVIGAVEITDKLDSLGISNAHGMNIGGQANFKAGKFTYEAGDFKVKCVVAQHSSSMYDGSYGGNPVGFIISAGDAAFYYSGDTGLTMDMQLIPRWAKLDFAVLPIGDNYTMGAEDALECARMINCKTVIGVHYDTFESLIKIDQERAKRIFSQAGFELRLVGIGETVDIKTGSNKI
jgi:L-ascorbate metabolism protein UlaG (beta-lactamase superfamily)